VRISESKLGQLLGTLDGYQLRRWERFVRSAYFNTNKELMDLAQQLRQTAPQYTISAQELWSLLSAEEIYNAQRMNRLLNAMLRLTERFLINERLAEQIPQQEIFCRSITWNTDLPSTIKAVHAG